MSEYRELRAALLQRRIEDVLDPEPIFDVMREHADRFDPPHTVSWTEATGIVCGSCGSLPDS